MFYVFHVTIFQIIKLFDINGIATGIKAYFRFTSVIIWICRFSYTFNEMTVDIGIIIYHYTAVSIYDFFNTAFSIIKNSFACIPFSIYVFCIFRSSKYSYG